MIKETISVKSKDKSGLGTVVRNLDKTRSDDLYGTLDSSSSVVYGGGSLEDWTKQN